MSADQNKVIVRKYFEEFFVTGDPSLANELLAPSLVHRWGSNEPLSREQIQNACLKFATAFHDIAVTIEDMIAEGDTVAARWSWSATHLGEVDGVAPTGEHVRFTGMHFFRIVDGKIIENWVEEDLKRHPGRLIWKRG